MMKNMTVTQVREMFGRLPNPYQHERDNGFGTPFRAIVKEELKVIPSAYDEPCPRCAKVVTFKLVETVYGLDWQIM